MTDSMNRSWSMTEGYRVEIFLLALVIGAIQWVLGTALGMGVQFAGLGAVVTRLAEFLITSLGTALNAVAAAVVYHDLRGFREGLGEAAT